MQVGEILQNGYTVRTTFWNDFSIADHTWQLKGSGNHLVIFENAKPCNNDIAKKMKAIKDTYERAFSEWKNNTEYLTELVMILNWKGWQWYESGIEDVAQLYFDLWEKADIYACSHLTGKDLDYFIRTTD